VTPSISHGDAIDANAVVARLFAKRRSLHALRFFDVELA
jgi:hypothetical protein